MTTWREGTEAWNQVLDSEASLALTAIPWLPVRGRKSQRVTSRVQTPVPSLSISGTLGNALNYFQVQCLHLLMKLMTVPVSQGCELL